MLHLELPLYALEFFLLGINDEFDGTFFRTGAPRRGVYEFILGCDWIKVGRRTGRGAYAYVTGIGSRRWN